MAMERQHRPIDKEFEECYYTGVLDISGRNLRLFPNIGDDIYDPLEVFTGVISGNRFDKFPLQVLNYVNIVSLNFHNNALRSVPADLVKLQQLRQLDLSRNFLQKLPSALCELQLETLSVNNNRLQSLPAEIGNMTSLKSLDVSCNDIRELPKSFTELHCLTYLNLRRNDIKELPTDIFKIPLWYLNINSNSFTRLPISLRHLTTLTEFHCSDNPLELPPAQVCVRGLYHVFKYLTEMEKYGSDPQLLASNRDESIRRRNKRSNRPTSDASTISGDSSDYERSFLDEMSTFVQSAFGSKDGHFLGRSNEPEQVSSSAGGGGSRHWTQFRNYEENSPYRSGNKNGSGPGSVRYRSQSPGPAPGQSNVQGGGGQKSSGSSGHFGTLPRSSKDSTQSRGLLDEPARSGSFHNYSSSNRVSSPVSESRALRTLSSENAPERTPSNPDITTDEKSYLSKKTELSNTSTPNQYHSSPHHHTKPSTSSPVPLKLSSDDSQDRPPSRDGSITPTPGEDVDTTEEPLTPKKPSEDFTVSNIMRLLDNHDFDFTNKWEDLGESLGVPLDTRQSISAQSVTSQDHRNATQMTIDAWFSRENSSPSWNELLRALEDCGQSSIVNVLKKTYLLLDDGLPTDVNLTPQHKPPSERQVSFSVTVSEIPGSRTTSVSSEPDEQDVNISRSISCPQSDVTSTSSKEELEEEFEDSESSPSPSPAQSPRKGPQPAPKPKKKDKDNTTWPRKRAGAPHKRKGDVFKSIGKQDPNFTVRRMEVHMQEELEKIQYVKKEVEDILSVHLSDDLGNDISDGILLCELVNKLHPNTISIIHRPKGSESITGPKKTMNIAAFIAACKKVRVPEALVCSAGDISEYKDPIRVCACIRGLLDTVSV